MALTYVIAGSRGGTSSAQQPTTNLTYTTASSAVVAEDISVTPPTVNLTSIIPAGRAGLPSAFVAETATATRTYVIAEPAVLTEPLHVTSASLSDTVVSSDSFSTPYFANLSDTAASSDVFATLVVLADFVTVSYEIYTFPESYSASLSDSAASSDLWPEPVLMFYGPLGDQVLSSDSYAPQSAFAPSLHDNISSFDVWNGIVTTGPTLECGPIALFPTLPEGYPVKLSLVLDATIGTTKSLREMRYPQQIIPLWDIEVPFEELVDQTQNQTPYAPFAGTANYMQLVQLFLMMYGKTGVFAFNAPWDNSRANQIITTNSANGQTAFPVFETWGSTGVATEFPVGMINEVTTVYVNGTPVSPTTYSISRSYVNFESPPAAGSTISLTFTFYYLCRFTEDEQDFDEFSKNRWQVPSLKFRAVYWPGCQ